MRGWGKRLRRNRNVDLMPDSPLNSQSFQSDVESAVSYDPSMTESNEDDDETYGKTEAELVTRDQVLDEMRAQAAADALGKSLEAMGYDLNCESFYSLDEPEVDQRYAPQSQFESAKVVEETRSRGSRKERKSRTKKGRKSQRRPVYASSSDEESEDYAKYRNKRKGTKKGNERDGKSEDMDTYAESTYTGEESTSLLSGQESSKLRGRSMDSRSGTEDDTYLHTVGHSTLSSMSDSDSGSRGAVDDEISVASTATNTSEKLKGGSSPRRMIKSSHLNEQRWTDKLDGKRMAQKYELGLGPVSKPTPEKKGSGKSHEKTALSLVSSDESEGGSDVFLQTSISQPSSTEESAIQNEPPKERKPVKALLGGVLSAVVSQKNVEPETASRSTSIKKKKSWVRRPLLKLKSLSRNRSRKSVASNEAQNNANEGEILSIKPETVEPDSNDTGGMSASRASTEIASRTNMENKANTSDASRGTISRTSKATSSRASKAAVSRTSKDSMFHTVEEESIAEGEQRGNIGPTAGHRQRDYFTGVPNDIPSRFTKSLVDQTATEDEDEVKSEIIDSKAAVDPNLIDSGLIDTSILNPAAVAACGQGGVLQSVFPIWSVPPVSTVPMKESLEESKALNSQWSEEMDQVLSDQTIDHTSTIETNVTEEKSLESLHVKFAEKAEMGPIQYRRIPNIETISTIVEPEHNDGDVSPTSGQGPLSFIKRHSGLSPRNATGVTRRRFTQIQEAEEGFESFLPGTSNDHMGVKSVLKNPIAKSPLSVSASSTVSLQDQDDSLRSRRGRRSRSPARRGGRSKSPMQHFAKKFISSGVDLKKRWLSSRTKSKSTFKTEPSVESIEETENDPEIQSSKAGSNMTSSSNRVFLEAQSENEQPRTRLPEKLPRKKHKVPLDDSLETNHTGGVLTEDTGFNNRSSRKKKTASDSNSLLGDRSRVSRSKHSVTSDSKSTMCEVVGAKKTLQKIYDQYGGGNEQRNDEYLEDLLDQMSQNSAEELETAMEKLTKHATKLGLSEKDLLFSIKSDETNFEEGSLASYENTEFGYTSHVANPSFMFNIGEKIMDVVDDYENFKPIQACGVSNRRLELQCYGKEPAAEKVKVNTGRTSHKSSKKYKSRR